MEGTTIRSGLFLIGKEDYDGGDKTDRITHRKRKKHGEGTERSVGLFTESG